MMGLESVRTYRRSLDVTLDRMKTTLLAGTRQTLPSRSSL
jgi:hypothetical protein